MPSFINLCSECSEAPKFVTVEKSPDQYRIREWERAHGGVWREGGEVGRDISFKKTAVDF